ncbi:MAG: hypothetical protein KAS39_05620, partial [Actinomycetia bacterium]|nr:hypothetical protein [Actinomycetes bacterium]
MVRNNIFIRITAINLSLLLCLILISFFPVKLFSEDINKEEIVQRSVVIFDIENSSRDKNLDYLSGSLPSSFAIVLKNSGTFQVMPRSKLKEYLDSKNITGFINDSDALKIAEELEIEIAVLGNFFTEKGKIEINLKAVDVVTKRTKIIDNAVGETGREIYDLIDIISGSMLDKMLKALPPLAREEIEKERLKEEKMYVEDTGKKMTFSMGAGAAILIKSLNFPLMVTEDNSGISTIMNTLVMLDFKFGLKKNDLKLFFNIPGLGNRFNFFINIEDTIWVFKKWIGINIGLITKTFPDEISSQNALTGSYERFQLMGVFLITGLQTELFDRIEMGFNVGIPGISGLAFFPQSNSDDNYVSG